MTCTICGSDKIVQKYSFNYGYLMKCNNCSCEFMSPQPTDDRLNEIYSQDYYTSWGVNNSAFTLTRQMKYKTGLKHLQFLKKFKNMGNLLDIGCAFGFFLEAAKDKGYQINGIEFSEFSASHAKKKLGDKTIFKGIVEDAPFYNESFDIITMFDLIEHTREPNVSLKKAIKLLAKDGIIMLSTPDVSSLSQKLMGKKWIHYKEEHLYYFNKKSFSFLAKKHNLKVEKVVRCKKVFFLSYVFTQFETYKHFLLTPIFKIIKIVTPKYLTHMPFSFAFGETLVVLKKCE